jgi:hypothetical protein
MSATLAEQIRELLIVRGPATAERVAEAIPELGAQGGPQRALILMRLDPTLERTGADMWAARGTALTDERRVRKSFEKFIEGRQGAPLTSAVRAVANDTGMPDYRALELLTAQFVVVGSNIFNRRR